MTTRQEKILSCIDPANQVGLEIGALSRPIVTPDMGDIRYVDHVTTKELRQKYAADPNVETEKIVEVSYVWGEKQLAELVGDDRFDYVVASHVIEHVPDLIGWLKEIHAILKPGGILSLAIPDKRYCFDYFRQPTQPADVVDAYLRNQRKPGPRQIFDSLLEVAFWQGRVSWGQEASFKPEDVVRVRPAADAWHYTSQIFASGIYHDVHCWVFTPDSLASLIRTLIQTNLFDFKVLRFYQTEGCEFLVALEAMDLAQDEATRQQVQIESIQHIFVDEALSQTVESEMLAAELAKAQEQSQQSRIHLQRLKADKRKLRQKVEILQAKLAGREQEIAAVYRSKLWQLRDKWFGVKKRLGI